MSNIPESHPLRHFFLEVVNQHFDSELGLRDSELQSYIANMLTDFCDTEQLYKIRDAGLPPNRSSRRRVEPVPPPPQDFAA